MQKMSRGNLIHVSNRYNYTDGCEKHCMGALYRALQQGALKECEQQTKLANDIYETWKDAIGDQLN